MVPIFLGLTIILYGETKEVTGGIVLILQDIADLKIIYVSWKHKHKTVRLNGTN